MIAFLKLINIKTWKAVISGWEPPTIQGKSTSKSKYDSPDAENQASLDYSRVFNVIYNGVDQNVFKLINTCFSQQKKLEKYLRLHMKMEKIRKTNHLNNVENVKAMVTFKLNGQIF